MVDDSFELQAGRQPRPHVPKVLPTVDEAVAAYRADPSKRAMATLFGAISRSELEGLPADLLERLHAAYSAEVLSAGRGDWSEWLLRLFPAPGQGNRPDELRGALLAKYGFTS